jgi:hypothetical protein
MQSITKKEAAHFDASSVFLRLMGSPPAVLLTRSRLTRFTTSKRTDSDALLYQKKPKLTPRYPRQT